MKGYLYLCYFFEPTHVGIIRQLNVCFPMSNIAVAEEIVGDLRYFAKLYSLDSLFVVGGYCRALVMGDQRVDDIDVASAYPDQALRLFGLFASEFLHTSPEFYHRTGTGVINTR